MRFLKSLQKKEYEKRHAARVAEQPVTQFEGKSPNGANPVAGMFANGNLKIGSPAREFEECSVAVETKEPILDAVIYNGVRPAALNGSHVDQKPFRDITVDASQVNERLVAITQSASPYCEEYRSLRTHLIHKSRERELRSIVVVSVGPSEGKSITALNLAWLLAQTDGIKALVIDGDMRRPSVADYLGVDSEIGLSDILAGKASFRDGIIHLKPSGLHIVPAGNSRDDIAELLSGPRYDDLLREAYESFDFVIIDAPPLSLFTDATVLVNGADGALLVVCADQTPYKDVDRLMDTFQREKFLGVVLNQSEDVLMSKQYYRYSYYKSHR